MPYLQYSLYPNLNRILVPKIAQLAFLGLLFYLGLLLNFYLLSLKSSTQTTITLIALILLVLLILIEIALIYSKTKKYPYNFYQKRLEYQNKSLAYSDITNIAIKQNLFDKLFNTATLCLNSKFKIRGISDYQKVYSYLQKLVGYYRKY